MSHKAANVYWYDQTDKIVTLIYRKVMDFQIRPLIYGNLL